MLEEYTKQKSSSSTSHKESHHHHPKREVIDLKAIPKVGKARLSWELEADNVGHIEIFGKYFNDKHFWRYDGFPRFTRSVDLDLDPLCPVTLRVHIVFNDGTWSKGESVNVTALHKNVVHDEFEGRTLLIYLPEGYDQETCTYPVIYMHDGQNLFSDRLAYVEDWQIDKAMDRLIRDGKMGKAVVVGIYNSSKRAEEYTPFADRRYGGGKAREFSAFVVDKILPYVESKYRVSKDRLDRAVMGSSFGGILSLWMGYTYPDVFSLVGAISPSMWIADGAMLRELERQPKKNIKIWIDQGTGEFSNLTRNTVNILLNKGYEYGKELIYYEVKDARHNEVAWGERVECPFIFFKGHKPEKVVDLRLDIQSMRQFSIGPIEYTVNPIVHFDNGIWYSLYKAAHYSIKGVGTEPDNSTAKIDDTGLFHFGREKRVKVTVKYDGTEKSITIENPNPPVEKKTTKKTKKS